MTQAPRSREFFAVRTVGEALAGFRPRRRTGVEAVGLAEALGRVPAEDVVAPAALPGFARASVDGYAVRAADTYGASDGLPAYLTVTGSVRMGEAPAETVSPGTALAIPTGGALPGGADAVVMVEYTQRTTEDAIEVARPVAPGECIVRADEDVARGAVLAPAGRPLRAHDLGLLASAGVTSLSVHARPQVGIVSTGDEVVPPDRSELAPGEVRDATASALAALVREAGGDPVPLGIVEDHPDRLRERLAAALGEVDVLVVSAGSSVGARDSTVDAIAELGPPGIWCHGLSVHPGKPTILAEAGDVPVIGLPGNPLSALVVFRLIGLPVVRTTGGWTAQPVRPVVRAVLGRDLPSAPGRLDVVQVTLADGRAEPLFGKSALLSTLARADGFLIVPEEASGLFAGTEVEVELYG